MFYQESCQFVVSSLAGEGIYPAVSRRSRRLKVRTERVCFAGQGDEDILSHFFGGCPLTEEAKSRSEDQTQVTLHQVAQRSLIAPLQVGLKQFFANRLLVLHHCGSGLKDSYLETCRWVGESDRNLCQSIRSSSLRGRRDRSPSGTIPVALAVESACQGEWRFRRVVLDPGSGSYLFCSNDERGHSNGSAAGCSRFPNP